MKKAFFAAMSLALLAGCTVTPDDLRGDSGRRFNATLEGSPEAVYQRIVEKAKPCIQRSAMILDADYFPKSARGTLVMRAMHELTYQTIFDVELVAGDPGKTEMKAYYMRSFVGDGDSFRMWPELLKNWGESGATPCPF